MTAGWATCSPTPPCAARLPSTDAGSTSCVNAEGRVLLSSTRIDGHVFGRICVLNHRTDRARVDEALDALSHHAA
ncbi:hypothetical protein FHX44_117773 [Pseudonocardia hierapolitana]|uniref:Uncharacterized protein n=1 Tax=Pseudonocardia hierapolitana TaxID=1128676 RepID=A0A561T3Y8_9PSEU|nr:hypothetical protein FHX44_117773 [Pseudonocardia hierapolitana]